jgi:hypothetical protein
MLYCEKVSLLPLRKIESSMAVAFIRGYQEILGDEASRRKAKEVIEKMAMESGKRLSGKENSLVDFPKGVQKIWSSYCQMLYLSTRRHPLLYQGTQCFTEIPGGYAF